MLKKVECSSCFGVVDCGRIPSALKDLGSMRLSVTAPTEVKVVADAQLLPCCKPAYAVSP